MVAVDGGRADLHRAARCHGHVVLRHREVGLAAAGRRQDGAGPVDEGQGAVDVEDLELSLGLAEEGGRGVVERVGAALGELSLHPLALLGQPGVHLADQLVAHREVREPDPAADARRHRDGRRQREAGPQREPPPEAERGAQERQHGTRQSRSGTRQPHENPRQDAQPSKEPHGDSRNV